MEIRDFIMARLAAARTSVSAVSDIIDDMIASLAAPDDKSAKKAKEEILEAVEVAIDESGLLSRCLEAAQHAMEQADPEVITAGEPDYDEVIDDGAEGEGEDD